MLRNNKGFTLIELVMIIVILGILAAVAIPKYEDLRSEARYAAVNGLSGALYSSATIYIAKNKGSLPTRAQVTINTTYDTGTLSVLGEPSLTILTVVHKDDANNVRKVVDLTNLATP